MIVLDTSAVVDFLNGRKESIEVIQKHKADGDLATTEITRFEIFLGIYQKKNVDSEEIKDASDFFNSLSVLPFGEGCGELCAKITAELVKKGEEIEQNDCLIASIILNNEFDTIITRNEKHFSRIKKLKVISY